MMGSYFSLSNLKIILQNKYNKWLLYLLGFHTLALIVFHFLNKANQTWDSAGHIGMSYLIAEQFRRLSAGDINIFQFLQTSDYYPPLIQTLGALISLIFGYHTGNLLFLSYLFFIFSLIILYILTDQIFNNKKVAFFTAFIFSMFPQVYEQSRVFHLDLPLVALLLLAMYLYIKSKQFTSRNYTIAFAVIFAFAQLTKWYGFIFILIPIVLDLLQNSINIKENIKKFTSNLSIGAIIVGFIALPWYIVNYNKILEYSRIFSEGEIDDPTTLSLETLLYYPQRILSHQILLLPTIMVVIGLIFLLIKNRKCFVYTFLTIITPLIIFTLIGNKNLRYVLPLTPVFSWIIAWLIFNATHYANSAKKILRETLASIMFVYLLAAFLFASFNQVRPQRADLNAIGVILSGPYYNIWYYEPQLYGYSREYWPVDEVWQFIQSDSALEKNAFGVTPLLDKKNFSLATFELERREERMLNMFVPVPYFQFEPFESNDEIMKYFDDNSVKYVLSTDSPGPAGLRNYAVLLQMNKFLQSRQNKYFQEIRQFDMPDGSWIKVYKRVPKGQVIEQPLETTCKNDAGIGQGIESIQLTPYHSYVFYTGHYKVLDFISGDFAPGTLHILQIENVEHSSVLDVYGLAHSGTSMCEFSEVGIDLTDAITRPLVESNHCGTDCEKVIFTKWTVGDKDFERKEYTRTNLPPVNISPSSKITP